MFTLDDLKHLDPTKLDLSKLDLSKLDPRRLDLPKLDAKQLDLRHLDLPTFHLPKFDRPKFDAPRFDLPELPAVDTDRLVGLARDAAYVGVGATVVVAQAADRRRRELTDQVTTRLRKLADAVA